MNDPIFISYRRNDQPGYVARIADDLKSAFGDVVFRDVENILAGDHWPQVLKRKVSQAQVVIAVVGSQWASTLAERRNISEPDYVRLELNTARDLGLPVIPVILEGAELPDNEQLDDLAWLLETQSHRLSDLQSRWSFDIDRLAEQIAQLTSLKRRRKFITPPVQITLAGTIAAVALIAWFVSTQPSRTNGQKGQAPQTTVHQNQTGDNPTQIGTNSGTLIINNTGKDSEETVLESETSQ